MTLSCSFLAKVSYYKRQPFRVEMVLECLINFSGSVLQFLVRLRRDPCVLTTGKQQALYFSPGTNDARLTMASTRPSIQPIIVTISLPRAKRMTAKSGTSLRVREKFSSKPEWKRMLTRSARLGNQFSDSTQFGSFKCDLSERLPCRGQPVIA